MKADLDALLDDMQRRRLYGSIEVKIEAGKIVLLRRTETFLANTIERNRGKEYVRNDKQLSQR